METAETKINQINTEGLKLQTKFTYENTLNLILEEMKNG